MEFREDEVRVLRDIVKEQQAKLEAAQEEIAKQKSQIEALRVALQGAWTSAHQNGSGSEHGDEEDLAGCRSAVCKRARMALFGSST